MAKKNKDKDQIDAFDLTDRLKTAICVPAIREAVRAWKAQNYSGITETTRELLNYWFKNDHKLKNGNCFRYYDAQQEAIETLIYIYEVEKIRTRKDLYEKYAYRTKELRIPQFDDYARYCIKMATGSGKTKVMALAIVWQFANAMHDPENYAKNFLILAPNVIVFERLRTDFESGRMFQTDPLIPKHIKWLWNMEYYMRGDTERTSSEGAIYLTNIQQFYTRPGKSKDEENDIMTDVLGSKPPANKTDISDFDDRIIPRDGLLMVINDEAHHTHDEDNEWNKFIRRLHTGKTITAQLDFSATPRYSKGSLFAWTISDYPLKQAILDQIIKRPIKGISKIEEAKVDIASKKYEGFLVAGVERWKEYNNVLTPLNKKPILFIMMNDTTEADDIGEWLQTKYPAEFGGNKTLVIHTDKSGEVSKTDLDKARRLAREVDAGSNPVNAIVSVLMLREGWDVQNVTVVVGLRPYSAKADILPEQTIGRGLRLMFQKAFSSYTERVDIIGNKKFMEFVDDLEKLENLKLDTFNVGKDKLVIETIMPMENKLEYDISIPELTSILTRKKSLAEEIAEIDVMSFTNRPIPFKEKELAEIKSFEYEGRDILTDEVLFTNQYQIPEAQTAEEIVGYYARKIALEIKLPSHFAVIAPKVKEFFKLKAFGMEVDLTDKAVIKAMGSNIAHYVVVKEFVKILRDMVLEEKEPELLTSARLLSSTPPFPTSKQLLEAKKTVFNFVACDNDYESAFARFLDKSPDIKAFAKLPEQFGFCIPYTDSLANLRNYYPDFIAVSNEGKNYIIETKGRNDLDVLQKDKYAKMWCEKATELTKSQWIYVKVMQKDFEELHPDNLDEMMQIDAS
jgi:type III restriction enzyme